MKERLVRALHDVRDHVLVAINRLTDDDSEAAAEELEAAATTLREVSKELNP